MQQHNFFFFFFLDLTENNRDCSWNLHFLFWSVQPHVPSLYTQVSNDFLLLFWNFSRFLTFKILNHQSTSSCSYLGNGLYAARLAILGAKDTDGSVSATVTQLPAVPFLTDTRWQTVGFCSDVDHRVFTSSCLPKKFREDVTIFGTTYKISGVPDGKWGKIPCCALPPRQWHKQNENIQSTSQIRQSRPHHSEVTKRRRACLWVVISLFDQWWSDYWAGLNWAETQLLSVHGFAGPGRETTHEAVWILPGLPLYCPAPRLTI